MSVIFSFLISSLVCFVFFRGNAKKQYKKDEQAKKENQVNESTDTFTIPLNKEFTLQNFYSNDKSFSNLIQNITNENRYNKFFILTGKFGSGKTHLLHAIANKLTEKNTSMNIRLISAESFIDEFVNSLSNKTFNDFRQKYRTLDVLCIENFELLRGKEATQEELFYTLVALLERKAYVGITITFPCNINKDFINPLAVLLQTAMMIEMPEADVEVKRSIIERHLLKSSLSKKSLDYSHLLDYDVPKMLGELKKFIAMNEL